MWPDLTKNRGWRARVEPILRTGSSFRALFTPRASSEPHQRPTDHTDPSEIHLGIADERLQVSSTDKYYKQMKELLLNEYNARCNAGRFSVNRTVDQLISSMLMPLKQRERDNVGAKEFDEQFRAMFAKIGIEKEQAFHQLQQSLFEEPDHPFESKFYTFLTGLVNDFFNQLQDLKEQDKQKKGEGKRQLEGFVGAFYIAVKICDQIRQSKRLLELSDLNEKWDEKSLAKLRGLLSIISNKGSSRLWQFHRLLWWVMRASWLIVVLASMYIIFFVIKDKSIIALFKSFRSLAVDHGRIEQNQFTATSLFAEIDILMVFCAQIYSLHRISGYVYYNHQRLSQSSGLGANQYRLGLYKKLPIILPILSGVGVLVANIWSINEKQLSAKSFLFPFITLPVLHGLCLYFNMEYLSFNAKIDNKAPKTQRNKKNWQFLIGLLAHFLALAATIIYQVYYRGSLRMVEQMYIQNRSPAITNATDPSPCQQQTPLCSDCFNFCLIPENGYKSIFFPLMTVFWLEQLWVSLWNNTEIINIDIEKIKALKTTLRLKAKVLKNIPLLTHPGQSEISQRNTRKIFSVIEYVCCHDATYCAGHVLALVRFFS